MIARLRGLVDHRLSGEVILDVQGVGYRILVPQTTYHELIREEQEITLEISTIVREDAILLYGFRSEPERRIFEILQGVSRIGPKLALAILSELSVDRIVQAILKGDSHTLSRVPGLGRKTAERIILDAKDRIQEVGPLPSEPGSEASPGGIPPGSDRAQTVLSALLNLGFPRGLAERAAHRAMSELGEDAEVERLIRRALKVVGAPGGSR